MTNEFQISLLTGIQEKATPQIENQIDLFLVLTGSLDISLNRLSFCLKKDDVVVINTGMRFSMATADKNSVILRLQIATSLINREVPSPYYFFLCNSVLEPERSNAELISQLKDLTQHYIVSEHISFPVSASFYQVLDTLCKTYLVMVNDIRYHNRFSDEDIRRKAIVTYINENYNSDISLSQMADNMHFTVPYLSRFIKKILGSNFSNYLNSIRLKHFMEQFLYADSSITKIALNCGFSNITTFNRVFRQAYGISPTEYKKEWLQKKKKTDAMVFHGQLLSKVKADLHPRADVPAETAMSTVVADVSQYKDYNAPWKKLLNFGSMSNFLNYRIRSELSSIISHYHVEYIRFWNVLDKEMYMGSYRGDELTSYDFSRIDEALDFLIQNDLKPFFHMGYSTPYARLYEDSDDTREIKNHFSFRSYNDMFGTFRVLMKHLTYRYGDQVDSWIFGLWYPERYYRLPEFFHAEGRINYSIGMYRILRELSPASCIGLSDFALLFENDRISSRIFSYSDAGIIPDIVTCVSYPYILRDKHPAAPPANGSTLSWKAYDNYMKDEIQNFSHLLQNTAWKNIPIWITEYSFTLEQREALNDMRYRGAYVIKNMSDICDLVQGAGYFMLSDTYSENTETVSNLYGGCGLLTKFGIQKPSAFALSFLSQMKSKLIAHGPNYILACDGSSRYTLILHNMKSLSSLTILGNSSQMVRDNADLLFADCKPLRLSLELKNIPNGRYRIRRNTIDAEHGDINSWLMNNTIQTTYSKQEVEHLQSVIRPELRLFEAVVTDGHLIIETTLDANDFVFYEFACLS